MPCCCKASLAEFWKLKSILGQFRNGSQGGFSHVTLGAVMFRQSSQGALGREWICQGVFWQLRSVLLR